MKTTKKEILEQQAINRKLWADNNGRMHHIDANKLIAEFMEDYAAAEREVLNQIENDPLLKLKDREIDLKAREEQRKEEEGEETGSVQREPHVARRWQLGSVPRGRQGAMGKQHRGPQGCLRGRARVFDGG